MKRSQKHTRFGFTLVEMMMAMGCGSMVLAALLAASTALQRSFAAVEGYSIATGDQLRVQDYIAMDCRRATSVSWNSGTQTLTVSVPNYYDSNGNPVAPTYNGSSLQYGSGTTDISYYKSATGNEFMRQVGGSATKCGAGAAWSNCAKAIATDVSSFNASVTAGSGASTVKCSVTFSPRFKTVNPVIAGTTVYAETFLRNGKARQ